jgi:hypothetical protein
MATKSSAAQTSRAHRLERNRLPGLGGDFAPVDEMNEDAELGIPIQPRNVETAEVVGETEDVTLPWEQWEQDHAQKRRRLVLIVAVAMAGIVAVWAISVSGTIAALRVAGSVNSASARTGFLERFSEYQKRLDAYSAQVTATTTAPAAPTSTARQFVESLKIHATEAATAPIAPVPPTP